MKTQKTLFKSPYFWLLLISVAFFSSARAQSAMESTEDAPDTATAEEEGSATVDAPDTLVIPTPPGTFITTPRMVSAKDLSELESAQLVLNRADAVVQHILTRIINEYGINVQTEVLNIKTGLIIARTTNTQ